MCGKAENLVVYTMYDRDLVSCIYHAPLNKISLGDFKWLKDIPRQME